jgi:hypothetical protein
MLRAPMRLLPGLALALLGPLAAACADDAQIKARYAPELAHGRHVVSVLGVYKDGRMSSDAWEIVGPRLSSPFGATCETAYGQLVAGNEKLSGAIDDAVRANGPSDDLLALLAPAAKGDLILVVTLAGHVGNKNQPLPDTNSILGSTPTASTGKYRGMGGGMPASRPTRGTFPGKLPAQLEMSAILYSVADKKPVGAIDMQYDGPSLDDALARMAAKFNEAMPGSACGAWDWTAQVDDNRIRELSQQQ